MSLQSQQMSHLLYFETSNQDGSNTSINWAAHQFHVVLVLLDSNLVVKERANIHI